MTTQDVDYSSDPFLRSLAILKRVLSAQEAAASPSPRKAPRTARRSLSPPVVPAPSTLTKALRVEVDQERQQRKSLDDAIGALTDSRKALQTQLEAAKTQATEKQQALEALQREMKELKAQHARELTTALREKSKAEQARMAGQKAVDQAEARVASLELHVQELKAAVRKKDELLQQAQKNHQADRAMQQKSIQELMEELKQTNALLKEAREQVTKANQQNEAAKASEASTSVLGTSLEEQTAGNSTNSVDKTAATTSSAETQKKRPLDDTAEEGSAKKPAT